MGPVLVPDQHMAPRWVLKSTAQCQGLGMVAHNFFFPVPLSHTKYKKVLKIKIFTIIISLKNGDHDVILCSNSQNKKAAHQLYISIQNDDVLK